MSPDVDLLAMARRAAAESTYTQGDISDLSDQSTPSSDLLSLTSLLSPQSQVEKAVPAAAKAHLRSGHVHGWSQRDGQWICGTGYFAGAGCGELWPSDPAAESESRSGLIADKVGCHTCGRLPTSTYRDGSRRYDHGHDLVTGALTWVETTRQTDELTATEHFTLAEWSAFLRRLGGSLGLLGLGRKVAAEMRGKHKRVSIGNPLGAIRPCPACRHEHAVGSTCCECPDCHDFDQPGNDDGWPGFLWVVK